MNSETIFLFFIFVTLTIVQIQVLRGYFKYNSLSIEHDKIKDKIIETFRSPAFYSVIFSIKNFNEWFKNNKDESIYAHAGIYLRTDKLSEHHVYDYIGAVTNGLLSGEDFDEDTILMFHRNIRENWMHQLRIKNK